MANTSWSNLAALPEPVCIECGLAIGCPCGGKRRSREGAIATMLFPNCWASAVRRLLSVSGLGACGLLYEGELLGTTVLQVGGVTEPSGRMGTRKTVGDAAVVSLWPPGPLGTSSRPSGAGGGEAIHGLWAGRSSPGPAGLQPKQPSAPYEDSGQHAGSPGCPRPVARRTQQGSQRTQVRQAARRETGACHASPRRWRGRQQ